LVYSWGLVTDSTQLEGSTLVVERIPAVIECRACGAATTLELPILRCGGCESTNVEVVSGQEFLVTALDLKEETAHG
jgi:hydrogenase nickel incorporation protein HypA/HybF